MRRFRRLRRAARAEEAGLTLVELLVVVALASVVATAVAAVVVQSFTSERSTTARVEALNEAKIAMERMTREVRAADPVFEAEDDRVRMGIHREAGTMMVTYEVADDGEFAVLTMEQEDEDGDVVTQTLATRLDPDTQVFTYLDSAGDEAVLTGHIRRVRLHLRLVPWYGNSPVDLVDEVTVRNARDIDDD